MAAPGHFVPGVVRVFAHGPVKTSMPGTRPGMTMSRRGRHYHDGPARTVAVAGARRARPLPWHQSGHGLAVRGRPRPASAQPAYRIAVPPADRAGTCGRRGGHYD